MNDESYSAFLASRAAYTVTKDQLKEVIEERDALREKLRRAVQLIKDTKQAYFIEEYADFLEEMENMQ